jgi:hypothetical protein
VTVLVALAVAGCTAAEPGPRVRPVAGPAVPSGAATVRVEPPAPVKPLAPPAGVRLVAPGCARARQVPSAVSTALLARVRPARLAGTRAPAGAQAVAVRRLLMSVDRYALRTQLPLRWADGALTDMAAQLGGVRGASADAMALAVATETGAYDPRLAGRSTGFARATAVWLVRSLACQHAAVSGAGWGAGDRPIPADLHQWQSPMWAMQAGLAGWLLWPYLDRTDRFRVAAMVVNEADRIAVANPQYYGAADGRVVRPGDTKAEEDAWMVPILALAAAMMPAHPHVPAWRRAEARFELAAFSTRADGRSGRAVDGAPLRRWLGGWNVRPDGTVINHRRLHPAYATNAAEGAVAVALHGLAGGAAPAAAGHGLDTVYGSVLRTRFAAPPYAAPGGTIYRSDSDDIYLPQGNDWGTRAAVAQFVELDAAAHTMRTAPEAPGYLLRHAGVLAAMQARAADGRAYQARREAVQTWAGETVVAETITRAWLLEWAAGNGRTARTNDDLSAAVTIPAGDATGHAWTRYRPGRQARQPAGNPVLLAPARADVPALGAPVRARLVAGRVLLTGAPRPYAGADVLVSAGGGYLVHVSTDAARTVIRLADGHRTCTLPALGRLPAACLDHNPPTGLTVVTTIDSPTTPELAVAVTHPS